MFCYVHTVQYYETDKMGVTHHSNYIRWMEEARVALLESLGMGYDKLEAMGILSPVTGVACEYRAPTAFRDEVTVRVRIAKYDGVHLNVGYEMLLPGREQPVLTGQSSHVFLNAKGAFVRMKRDYPQVDALMRELAARDA
ncbi:MAG: acyl-CoA thioesterase [Clostridiales bacterium]|nr:acyl-CoA thioesterase [Clostridiales bacterium]